MQDSIPKKFKRVGAFVAGGVLLCLGIIGLPDEFSEAKNFITDPYGRGLAILLIASGILIGLAAWKQPRHMVTYAAGGVLIFLGALGLLIEFSKASPSSTNFYGCVLGTILIASGALTCVAVRLNYGGGLWSFFGSLFVAAAILRVAFAWQVYMQGGHFISPVVFHSITAGLWGVGCYCLVWGHMRHHRKKATPSNLAL
jgi:hypothetical protein